MPVRVAVTKNLFPTLARALPQRTGQVLQRSAQRLAQRAKDEAPVDTGRLRSEIEAVKEGPYTWAVISPTPYAVFVVFGTSKMAPNDYMLRAVRAEEPDFYAEVDKLLERLV